MASAEQWAAYHDEWNAIDKRYPLFGPDYTDEDRAAMVMMRANARDELRAVMAVAVRDLGYGGAYLIPV